MNTWPPEADDRNWEFLCQYTQITSGWQANGRARRWSSLLRPSAVARLIRPRAVGATSEES